jgi:hypothetical protein
MAGQRRSGTYLTVPSDRTVDDSLVYPPYRLIIQTKSLHDTRAKSLNSHICRAQQPKSEITAAVAPEVDSDTALVTFERVKRAPAPFLRRVIVSGLTLQDSLIPRSPTPAGFFDLDHVGTKIT